ncbi:MAG: CPBP family intramembrane metalloprotease [Lachnospiraceae bacterium]|nr:CPBP family intramembrane metalloprotease [Lachnospiraceae bacterium]
MGSKRVNRIFLTMILLHIVVIVLLGILTPVFQLGMIANFILSQLMILGPAVIGTKLAGENVLRFAGFRKIRISTGFMICLFTYLSMPLTVLVNAISMFFVENTVSAMSGDILQLPFVVMLLIIGVLAPLSEEFVFRGIFFQGYKRSGTTLQAILLSALLFSLVHMNFNQAAYAFVIGIIVALLVEATGSLWSSVLFHVLFNSGQVCLMYVSDWLTKQVGVAEASVEEAALNMEVSQEVLLTATSKILVVAAVATLLALGVLIWIAKNEKREECLFAVWREKKNENKKRDKMITVPLIVAIIIALLYMGLLAVLPYLL